MKPAGNNRWGHRDATMILVAFRHGLRVSELVDLHWNQIDFNARTMAVRRAKKGTPSTHTAQVEILRRIEIVRSQAQAAAA